MIIFFYLLTFYAGIRSAQTWPDFFNRLLPFSDRQAMSRAKVINDSLVNQLTPNTQEEIEAFEDWVFATGYRGDLTSALESPTMIKAYTVSRRKRS